MVLPPFLSALAYVLAAFVSVEFEPDVGLSRLLAAVASIRIDTFGRGRKQNTASSIFIAVCTEHLCAGKHGV